MVITMTDDNTDDTKRTLDIDKLHLLNINLEVATEDPNNIDDLTALKDELFELLVKHNLVPLTMSVFDIIPSDEVGPNDIIADTPFDIPDEVRGGYVSPKMRNNKKLN